MISIVRSCTTHRARVAAPAATLCAVVASTLLAGLTFCTAEAAPIPTPNFGAWVNLGWAGTDGGMGVFSASKSYSFSGTQTTYSQGAVANLATGSLHASTFASMDCATYGCPQSWGVGTTARLADRLVFTNTGENIALLPVTLKIDGNCAGDAPYIRAQYRFSFSHSPVNADTLPYHDLSCDGETDVLVHHNLLSFMGNTALYAFVELSTGVGFNRYDTSFRFGLVDFGNTLKVEITLPPGVTMQSASGVFPSISATAVPEPATIAVLGAGLAGLGIARRRRVVA